MADAEIKELVVKMAQNSEQQQAQILQQQQQISGLIEAIQGMPGIQRPVAVNVNPAPIAAHVVRAEKVQRLAMAIRKTNRLKEFKHTKDANIRTYIKKFEEELKSLKVMVGIADDLSRDEYIPLLRASLDYNVLKRLEQVFSMSLKDHKQVSNIFCLLFR